MKHLLLPLIVIILIQNIGAVTFDETMQKLETLEQYMKDFKKTRSKVSLNFIMLAYIREGRFHDLFWKLVGGDLPGDLKGYIEQRDKEAGTNVQELRTYEDIELPSKEKLDFGSAFATMNGIEKGRSFNQFFGNLVGWGGDLLKVFREISAKNGTLDELIIEARKIIGKSEGFNEGDLLADIDGPNILKRRMDHLDITFANHFKTYYSNDYKYRIYYFTSYIFEHIKQKDKEVFRKEVFKTYKYDLLINILECVYGLRKPGFLWCIFPGDIKSDYTNHHMAVAYAFADYLFENYVKP